MNLLESMMEKCVLQAYKQTDTPDGLGGFIYAWTDDGAEFDAAIIKGSSPAVNVAEQAGVNEQYTVVTYSSASLDFHDVFKRKGDGAVFRVTGYSRDSEAPAASSVQIAKVTAERWTIPE